MAKMKTAGLLLSTLMMLPAPADAGVSLAAGKSKDAPYIGQWDCGVATFTFTEDSYSTGDEPMAILKVDVENGNYHFLLTDDYSFWVSSVTDTSMEWLSDATGDNFSCKRIAK